MTLISYQQGVSTPSYPILEKFGGKGKHRSPKKLKILIEVPNVFQVKVHVLSFNMILISSPQPVLTPSYPILEKFGRSERDGSPKNKKILTEVYYVCEVKVQCSQLQYEPSPTSIACSQTELFISEKRLGDQVKGRSPKKLKSLIEVPNVFQVKEHSFSFNMILISSPQRVLRPSFPFRRKFWR